MTTLIISNEEMNDIMKIIKSLEESGLLIKGVNETIRNEAQKPKGRFLIMVLGTLGTSLFRNLLGTKGTVRAGEDTIRAGKAQLELARIFNAASSFNKMNLNLMGLI